MYCFGTHCQCQSCGKRWSITYKDALEYNTAIKEIQKTAKLGSFVVLGSFLSGNRLSMIDSQVMTNGIVNNANATLARFHNGELLQKDHCPECRNPEIYTEEFYYEADSKGNYIRAITKGEYQNSQVKIIKHQQVKNRQSQ